MDNDDDTFSVSANDEESRKKTRMNFQDIAIKGNKDDFQGLRFFNGGWARDFWNEFPTKSELMSYNKLKSGR